MKLEAPGTGPWARLCLLALALFANAAFADEYTPVNDLLRSGQLTAAMAKADQYLAANPRDPQMRFLKGLIQQDAGQLTDAITTYNTLITDYPELPEPYNNVAVLYANQGQYGKAREALEMAIRNKQSYAIAYENLGDVYVRLAGQSYNQALQLDGRNTSIAPKLTLIRQMFTAPVSSAAPAAPASAAK